MEDKNFDFDDILKQAGEQLRSGKPLTGQDGVFTPLLKQILEASVDGELDAHFNNRRNGHGPPPNITPIKNTRHKSAACPQPETVN